MSLAKHGPLESGESESAGRSAYTILMTISPSSKLSDIEALFDTYGVKFTRNGRDIQAGALWHIQQTGGIGVPPPAPIQPITLAELFPEIDPALDLCMVRCEPIAEEQKEPKTRWPFFVESKLLVMFSVGWQWWQYEFNPGKTYTDRAMDRAALPESSDSKPAE